MHQRLTDRTPEKVERRRRELLEALVIDQWTPVDEIIGRTSASQATVRRDLRFLERKRAVRRQHGAVRLAEPCAFSPFLDAPGFREQVHRMAREKRRIGMATAALIGEGETIAISSGTTTTQVAQALRGSTNPTVVTNAVQVAMELGREKEVKGATSARELDPAASGAVRHRIAREADEMPLGYWRRPASEQPT
jgi:DeoR family transcriptional regulator of aga operon